VAYSDGAALHAYRCDLCGEGIREGAPCIAREIWSDLRPRLMGYVDEYLDRDSESAFDGRGIV